MEEREEDAGNEIESDLIGFSIDCPTTATRRSQITIIIIIINRITINEGV